MNNILKFILFVLLINSFIFVIGYYVRNSNYSKHNNHFKSFKTIFESPDTPLISENDGTSEPNTPQKDELSEPKSPDPTSEAPTISENKDNSERNPPQNAEFSEQKPPDPTSESTLISENNKILKPNPPQNDEFSEPKPPDPTSEAPTISENKDNSERNPPQNAEFSEPKPPGPTSESTLISENNEVLLTEPPQENEIVILEPTPNDEISLPKTQQNEEILKPKSPYRWPKCPPVDMDGKLQTRSISSSIHGGFCNLVWEYLSIWATAQQYGLYPIIPERVIKELSQTFENDFSIPSFEEVKKNCNITWTDSNRIGVSNRKELMNALTEAVPGSLLMLPVYVTHTEAVIPLWRQIPLELRVRNDLRNKAQKKLHSVKTTIEETGVKVSDLQFICVHIRRTDYLHHMEVIYPGAKIANEAYLNQAMNWFRSQLEPSPVAFIVASDDLEWCHTVINKDLNDVFIIGDSSSQSEDLSLLSSCNHSIITYGTYGLASAALTQGKYTIMFDTRNSTHPDITSTKEMQFANRLPGWIAMNENGDILDTFCNMSFVLEKL